MVMNFLPGMMANALLFQEKAGLAARLRKAFPR
jgi:hypothetical protein